MIGKRGFTLIEVLIVVIILGILATLAIPQFTSMVKRARLAEAWTGLGAVRTAQAIYKMEDPDGDYATTMADLASLVDFELVGADYIHGHYVMTLENVVGDTDFDAVATGQAGGACEDIIARVNADGERAWSLDGDTTWSGDAGAQP
jgi:prepilin-type N-terminal cleavage/methylation domain-containing protein